MNALSPIPVGRPDIPLRLAAVYPQTSLTNRQRSLVVRLLGGEDIRYPDLHRHEQRAAFQLHDKRVISFAPATNRLMLVKVFADGSRAELSGLGWAVAAGPRPGSARIGCTAAEWAAQANAGRL